MSKPIPKTLKLAAICAAALSPAPAEAADLAIGALLPPRALPPVVAGDDAILCSVRPGTVFYERPYGEPFGPLPAGLVVEVIDVPFSTHTDLFVRIKSPSDDVYYGYVPPKRLTCH